MILPALLGWRKPQTCKLAIEIPNINNWMAIATFELKCPNWHRSYIYKEPFMYVGSPSDVYRRHLYSRFRNRDLGLSGVGSSSDIHRRRNLYSRYWVDLVPRCKTDIVSINQSISDRFMKIHRTDIGPM